jgi:hypothetical protein
MLLVMGCFVVKCFWMIYTLTYGQVVSEFLHSQGQHAPLQLCQGSTTGLSYHEKLLQESSELLRKKKMNRIQLVRGLAAWQHTYL